MEQSTQIQLRYRFRFKILPLFWRKWLKIIDCMAHNYTTSDTTQYSYNNLCIQIRVTCRDGNKWVNMTISTVNIVQKRQTDIDRNRINVIAHVH